MNKTQGRRYSEGLTGKDAATKFGRASGRLIRRLATFRGRLGAPARRDEKPRLAGGEPKHPDSGIRYTGPRSDMLSTGGTAIGTLGGLSKRLARFAGPLSSATLVVSAFMLADSIHDNDWWGIGSNGLSVISGVAGTAAIFAASPLWGVAAIGFGAASLGMAAYDWAGD